jgi:hypothetical protein
MANATGEVLAPEYAGTTREPREGSMLPDHLVGQLKTEGH